MRDRLPVKSRRRRIRGDKRPSGRCGTKFSLAVRESYTSGSLRGKYEREIGEALKALELVFGVEDVRFLITRGGSSNGKFGEKIPDFRIVTPDGPIFLEVSVLFSQTELDALQFLRRRYQVEVIAVDEALALQIIADPEVLGRRISEARTRMRVRQPNAFSADILKAAEATKARRAGYDKQIRTPTGTAPKPAKAAPGTRTVRLGGGREFTVPTFGLGAYQPATGFAAAHPARRSTGPALPAGVTPTMLASRRAMGL